ncbi:MAG: tetratricopeptide repeat protein [Gemmatimonadota bacterium]|nr:tetratricopeptide repeat protein [Gemmatimonadota bacterium]
MSAGAYLAELRERFDLIHDEMDGATAAPGTLDRAAIRAQIVQLFRDTEGTIDQLAAFKEEIRALVEQFKSLPAAETHGLAPPPPHADHLGSSTFRERGWNAIAAGDPARAVSELTRALELAPDDPQAEGLLGWARMLQERYDEALGSFLKVLTREPNDALARVNLGYICLKKGIFGEAIEHLSRVIRLDADRKATLYAHFYLGLVYLEREMYGDARAFFTRALELGPNLIEAHWHTGRTWYLEGGREEAVTAWQKGADANRFNVWGERCTVALARVERGEDPRLGESTSAPAGP